jgi:hypothetical protein
MNSAKEAKEKDSDVRDLWNTQVSFVCVINNFKTFRSSFSFPVWVLSLELEIYYVSLR